jgi:hypothetical protein
MKYNVELSFESKDGSELTDEQLWEVLRSFKYRLEGCQTEPLKFIKNCTIGHLRPDAATIKYSMVEIGVLDL